MIEFCQEYLCSFFPTFRAGQDAQYEVFPGQWVACEITAKARAGGFNIRCVNPLGYVVSRTVSSDMLRDATPIHS